MSEFQPLVFTADNLDVIMGGFSERSQRLAFIRRLGSPEIVFSNISEISEQHKELLINLGLRLSDLADAGAMQKFGNDILAFGYSSGSYADQVRTAALTNGGRQETTTIATPLFEANLRRIGGYRFVFPAPYDGGRLDLSNTIYKA